MCVCVCVYMYTYIYIGFSLSPSPGRTRYLTSSSPDGLTGDAKTSVVGCKIPRKENSPIFFFSVPPPCFPGFTRG